MFGELRLCFFELTVLHQQAERLIFVCIFSAFINYIFYYIKYYQKIIKYYVTLNF